jgi:hypothetical protein
MIVVELLCPECLTPLQSVDGQKARCPAHDSEFQILFTRIPLPSTVQADQPPVILAPDAVCAQHPSVAAAYACGSCGAALCVTCDFPQSDGSHLCPNCAQRQAAVPPVLAVAAVLPSGVRCAQHANLAATSQCRVCGAFMCQTCVFDLPGGIKVCPACATAAPKLSPKRKKLLIGSFALAVWCTIVMAALFAGIFRGFIRNKEDQQLFGILLMFLLLVPSIIGFAMGLSSMDRRLSNSIAMWIATVWNGVILGSFILLIIVGLMK